MPDPANSDIHLSENPILVVDEDQVVLSVNPAAAVLFGYSEADIVGQPISMLFPGRFSFSHRQLFQDFLDSGDSSRKIGNYRKVIAQRKDGTEFNVLKEIFRRNIGDRSQLIAVLRPVSKDNADIQPTPGMAGLVDDSPNPILRVRLDGTILYANPQARAMLAPVTRSSITGAHSLLSPEEWREPISLAASSGKQIERTFLRNGRTYILQIVPVHEADFANLFAVDVTEKTKERAELDMASSILASASNLVLVADSQAKIVYVSPSVTTMLGYSPEEVLDEGWWKILADSGEPITQDHTYVRQAAAGLIPIDSEAYAHNILHKDGSRRIILISDAKGPYDQLIGIGQDITALTQVQVELLRRNEFMEQVLNTMGQGLTIMNAAGTYDFVNPAFARIAAIRAARKNGQSTTYDLHLIARDGSDIYVQATGVPRFLDGEYGGSISVMTDITERRRLENALRAGEEAISALYDIATRQASFPEKIENLLQMGCRRFGMQLGFLGKIEADTYTVEAVQDSTGNILQGQQFTLSQTYCSETINTDVPLGIEHASGSAWSVHPCYQRTKMEAYLGTRVMVGGQLYGTLNFSSWNPRSTPFNPLDRNMLSLMAQWLGTEIDREATAAHLRAVASELERSNIDLAEARDRAMESSQVKSSFLAMMSHEIRTPMNAILGMNELLLDTELDEQQREFATIVSTSANALLVLINDILDLSRIEAGKLQLHPAPFRPARLFQEVVDLFRVRTAEKQIQLISNLDPKIPDQLHGDADRIRQILINLVGNAVKFTNYGVVSVSAFRQYSNGENAGAVPGVQLRFDVRDTGIGIPEKARATLFEPFTQVDNSATRKHSGSGLGLAISRRLVEMMGGTIGFNSMESLGSHFWFSLPFPGEAAEKGPSPSAPVKAAAPGSQNPSRIPIRPVLVVEDNSANQVVAMHQFHQLGVPVQVMDSGIKAVESIVSGAGDYAIVFMDIMLPDLDGLAATRLIRAHETKTGDHIPIVAMTASAMAEDRRACLEAGMDDYIRKPASLAAITEILGKWIE
jgi:PAS domain S-box-containing protein